MSLFFLIVGILMGLLAALVFSAHMSEGLSRASAEFLGKEYKPDVFLSIPFYMSFLFGLCALVLIVNSGAHMHSPKPKEPVKKEATLPNATF